MSTSLRLRHTGSRQRGVTLVWAAITMFVLVGFVALAVDFGYAYYTTQKLQNAADAAALAGAQRVWFSHGEARERAMEYSAANEAGGDAVLLDENASNDPEGDIVIGIYDKATRSFTPSTDKMKANAVMVNAKRREGSPNGPLPLVWGGIFGVDSTEFSRWGIAVADGGPHYSDLIALNDDDPLSFYIYGHGHLDLGSGTAQVNSSDPKAAMYQGTHITYLYKETNIVGGYDERGNPKVTEQGDQNEGEDYVPDPLASLPTPAYNPAQPAGTVITGSGSAETRFSPGYYPGGLNMQAGQHVVLEPGIYILGDDFELNGHSTLEGYNTMFYLVNGSVKDNGTGQVYLTPTTMDPYAQHHLQFWQAPGNTEMATFNGNSVWTSAAEDDPATPDVDESTQGTGTLYFPDATLELGGNGEMYFNGLIADKIVVYGDGEKHVTSGYDGDEGGDKVWLVE